MVVQGKSISRPLYREHPLLLDARNAIFLPVTCACTRRFGGRRLGPRAFRPLERHRMSPIEIGNLSGYPSTLIHRYPIRQDALEIHVHDRRDLLPRR